MVISSRILLGGQSGIICQIRTIDAIIGDIVRENDDIKSIDVLAPVIEKNDINFK